MKNEARSLPWVLPPLFEAVQHVVVIDNQSDDGTPDVAREVAEQSGAASRLTVTEYPFKVCAAAPSTSAPPRTRCTTWPTSTTGPSPT